MRADAHIHPAQAPPEIQGLACVLIDALTNREWVLEEELARDLLVSEEQVRKTLSYLAQDQLVTRAETQVKVPPNPAANPDDIVQQHTRKKVYVCLDYPRAVDIIRLRIHSIRAALKASAEEEHLVQEFFCLTPTCNGRRYTSLDAADIIHPETNAFHCEACGAELALDTGDDGDEEGMNSFERARQRRDEARQLIGQFDEEIKPLEEAIAKALASGVDPPDHGALRDWLQVRNNAAREQQRIANAALARGDAAGAAAATAARPARQGGMFDFLEDIEFEVQLEGDEGAGGAPVDGAAASGAGPQGGAGPSSGGGAAGGRPSLLASRQRKVIPPWHAKRQQQQQAARSELAPAAAPVTATAPGQGAAAAATASQTVADEEFAAEFIRQMYAFQQTQRQLPDATAASPAAAAPAPAPVVPAPQTQETQDDSDEEEWEDV